MEFRHFFWLVSNFSKNIYYFFQPSWVHIHKISFLNLVDKENVEQQKLFLLKKSKFIMLKGIQDSDGKLRVMFYQFVALQAFFFPQPSSTVLGSVTSMVISLKSCSIFLLLFYCFAWFWQALFIYLCGWKCGDIRLTDWGVCKIHKENTLTQTFLYSP